MVWHDWYLGVAIALFLINIGLLYKAWKEDYNGADEVE